MYPIHPVPETSMQNTDLTQFRAEGTLYLSAPEAAELIRRKGLANCLGAMADNIRDDFKRWPEFDKTARVASHSKDGVIELMPVADAQRYSFKYVNGHPSNSPPRCAPPPCRPSPQRRWPGPRAG
jgi:ornithine cyclodeaminase